MKLLQAIDDLARNFLIDDRTPVELVVALGRLRKAAADVAALLPLVAPFDLAKALAGAPIVTRDGRAVEVYALHDGVVLAVVGIDRKHRHFNLDGTHRGGLSHLDLFMKVAP